MDFVIVKSNIVNISVDALVLPTNPHLKMGSGVSEVLFKAAGKKELEEECRMRVKSTRKLEMGDAIPTSAYNLSARYIIHTVVPKWIDGNSNEYEALSTAYLTALNVADIMGCESIAFPLLASGNNGFDLNLAFEIAKQSIKSYKGKNLKQIILVIYGTHIAEIVTSQGYQYIEFIDFSKKSENGKKPNQVVNTNYINNVVEFLRNPENRKMLIDKGAAIAMLAIAIRKKDGDKIVKAIKNL